MNVSIEQYQQVLEKAFSKHYYEGSDVWSNDVEMRCFPALIQGVLKLDSDSTVLDIGCGAGADIEYFAGIFKMAMGIDIYYHNNWNHIHLAYPNARFFNHSFDSFETDIQFDIILDNGCFHHQHPDQRIPYLQKISSLLNQQGCYALSTFKNETKSEFLDGNGLLHKYFKNEELHNIIADAGLIVFYEFDIYRKRHNDYYRLSFIKANDKFHQHDRGIYHNRKHHP